MEADAVETLLTSTEDGFAKDGGAAVRGSHLRGPTVGNSWRFDVTPSERSSCQIVPLAPGQSYSTIRLPLGEDVPLLELDGPASIAIKHSTISADMSKALRSQYKISIDLRKDWTGAFKRGIGLALYD